MIQLSKEFQSYKQQQTGTRKAMGQIQKFGKKVLPTPIKYPKQSWYRDGHNINRIMGNEQCAECSHQSLQNQAYGSHELLRKGEQVFAVVEKLVDSPDNKLKDTVIEQLKIRKALESLHVVRLLSYRIVGQVYGFKATMMYEYVPKTLRMRIHQLQARKQQFSERELFALVYGIESGLAELSKQGINHNCLNLDTIVLKNNIYKLTDVSSTTYLTSYDLVIKGDRQQFLSERILDAIYNMCLSPTYELKDDLFTLGMIVLAVAVGRDATYFYNWNAKGHGTLEPKNVEISLKAVQKNYSSKLVKKIKCLLYESDNNISEDETNLTENLFQLEEQMTRVLFKVKKVCEKGGMTQNETTAGTPQKSLKAKARSYRTNTHFQ